MSHQNTPRPNKRQPKTPTRAIRRHLKARLRSETHQRPEGRDKARALARKNKAQEKQQRLAFLDIKRREVKCREQEIEQQDM
nr:hypothetical protein [Tanacetum cinerariifolium]